MARNRKRDPRTDPEATLSDFVYRINRMGFPNAQRIDVPIWTVKDIQWCAVEFEKCFRSFKDLGFENKELDPLQRVLHARWAAVRLAHALRHRTSNFQAKAISSGLSRTAY